MAVMIPARIDDNAPNSEKRVFDLLERDPDTKDWTVLHSLGLARRPSAPYGEIDFVAIIPGKGIICLEVKGGNVFCNGGVWQTMNRYGEFNRLKSPFMQARASMNGLKDLIASHFNRGAPEERCLIGYAVVFPDVACPPTTSEFERLEAIDYHDLKGPISRTIARCARHWLEKIQPYRNVRLPTPSEVKSVKNFLRPNFERVVSRSVYLDRNREKLLGLSEEQYERLDELEANPRCLFEGPAGTGKTLLALEYARRADRAGQKTLFVCFNRLLAQWIKRQTGDTGIVADTWHEVVRQSILRSEFASEFESREREAFESRDGEKIRELFDDLYPFYGELALEESGATFDTLVIDEAQDILGVATRLDYLNRALRGGLAGGRWAVFGDFMRQALYNDTKSMDPVAALSEYNNGRFTVARLTRNFRNTHRIAMGTAAVTGFDNLPFKLGQEQGLPVQHNYWRTPGQQIERLSIEIDKLIKDGVPAEDIVLLSPSKRGNYSLADIENLSGVPLIDMTDRNNTTIVGPFIKFSTIHSFKGLESPVVFIIDIDWVDGHRSESLLYVGMTRAQSLLTLMINQKARQSVESRLRSAQKWTQD